MGIQCSYSSLSPSRVVDGNIRKEKKIGDSGKICVFISTEKFFFSERRRRKRKEQIYLYVPGMLEVGTRGRLGLLNAGGWCLERERDSRISLVGVPSHFTSTSEKHVRCT